MVTPTSSTPPRFSRNSARSAAVVLESFPPLIPMAIRSLPRRSTWDRNSRFTRRSTKSKKCALHRCSPLYRIHSTAGAPHRSHATADRIGAEALRPHGPGGGPGGGGGPVHAAPGRGLPRCTSLFRVRTAPTPLSGIREISHILRGNTMDINQLGLVLMGTVLGWFLLFAVRRYKVQWGAFAAFMAVVFGVSMMSFLYARDLLAYYGIGIFLGFVSNMVVRVAGTTAGGKFGEGLLEISAFERKE